MAILMKVKVRHDFGRMDDGIKGGERKEQALMKKNQHRAQFLGSLLLRSYKKKRHEDRRKHHVLGTCMIK